MRLLFGTALFAWLSIPAPVRAQETADHDWETSFSFAVQDFTVDSAPWSTWTETAVGLTRVIPRGSVRFEAIQGRRFDDWDATLGVDAWSALWERGYGNLHVQVTPDAGTRADLDVAAAVFQGVDGGWEIGGGWRHQRFDAADVGVDALTLTAARYLDGWYLRGGAELAGRDGLEGATVTAVARGYFAPPGDLVEVGVAWGEGPEMVGAGPAIGVGRGGRGHVRFQIFPWPFVGFGASAEVRSFEDLPVRHGLSLSLRARW
jgi:YaiO family outer membrane protein